MGPWESKGAFKMEQIGNTLGTNGVDWPGLIALPVRHLPIYLWSSHPAKWSCCNRSLVFSFTLLSTDIGL